MVLLFLIVSFILGVAVWAYRNHWAPLPITSEEGSISHPATKDPVSEVEEEEKTIRRIISINEAAGEDLERLPGIGPVIAARIIEYRKQHNGFRSIEELTSVKGVGKKTIEKLKPYVTLN